MKICLGVFYKMCHFARKNKWYTYSGFSDEYDKLVGTACPSILEVVSWACNQAEEINFCLDDIRLPIPNQKKIGLVSWTCAELTIILNNPLFLDKTTFWIDGKPVDKQKVVYATKQKILGDIKDYL